MKGWSWFTVWVILKGMTAKPIETNWGSAIVTPLLGGYMVYSSIPCKNSIDGAFIGIGCYCILLGILMLGELTFIPRLEKRAAQREEEEEARRTAERRARRVQSRAEKRQARATELANALAAHQPTYAATPVAAYAPAEESPVAVPAVAEPVSAVAEEEEKKNTLTPLNISTTTKITESSTKKKTYTRRYI